MSIRELSRREIAVKATDGGATAFASRRHLAVSRMRGKLRIRRGIKRKTSSRDKSALSKPPSGGA